MADEIHEQRLTLVDAATGNSAADFARRHVHLRIRLVAGWKRFITTAANGNGDDNWYIAALYTVDVVTGETKRVYRPEHANCGAAVVSRRRGRLHISAG